MSRYLPLPPPLLCAAIAVAAPLPALAQGGPPPQEDTITVGLGLGVTTDYDGANEYKLIPGGVLQGTVRGHDFRLNGPRLFIDAIPNDPARRVELELGPVVGLRTNRTGKVEDPQVNALGKLDTAVELGLRGGIGISGIASRTDKLSFTATAVRDVAGAHDSYRLSPAIEYSTLVGRRTFVRAAITADFAPGDYARYYFGVTPEGSAASGLAAFDPQGGLESVGANVLATYSLSGGRKGWSLFGIASYSRLQGDFAASPLVRDAGSANQFFGSAGVGYTF
ncbi:MipA/OmpV family protein [Altererythrobacter sp. KTW20L]|uniref:MipA/OmpV family protein n=1 Tax=Altererythrobacter sp. KTW20L TaxID=2942210 RepID=UPI0020C11052|nr:MipA/OmpV family protein [Altererythrobacter sp. KTW20L]MCL6250510.1 MipA/OmpV family protein [Altererythrobacter sp. KTW20L]